MLNIIEKIERYVVYILVFLLLLSVILGTADLSWTLLKGFYNAPNMLIELNTLFDSFALFLVIVVGLELLKSIKSYLVRGSINPAFVIEVAIIALGNKLITLDLKHADPELLFGIAAILLGLSITYFVLRKSGDPAAFN
ncbi:phosphate-starvation-inducible PsiE family protein [Methylococcus sp. ANG]|uniref:phosphate-starvation-inducible PsiE family protein n=1 Tax=unclassified Methylococcus TaxID=2618889 RepID=UPI001C533DD5|nr:phosphate-starvation-inducible PsiE family protein [Methylococcus sp. Mc7]QXP85438.1 phosphate-starvation-inducible PsiE family protein [Methylococcus sp. Mc7]